MKCDIKNKNIILGVSGGIAAYKSVELLRLFKKSETNVRVIMTQNAKWFVGQLTFEALSENPVSDSLFLKEGNDASIKHIQWAQEADAVVIAPATANIIGKIAGGIADDALSTFILAVTAPILICPSMNTNMYKSKAVQRNLKTLKNDGFTIIDPSEGELACGTTGPGRMPEPEEILDRLLWRLSPKDLQNKKILVTAGPTQEHLDPVRFISNPSSGKMGYAIAKAAEYRGADVTLVSGPSQLLDPVNVNTIRVKSAEEMGSAVFEQFETVDIVIKAAAVSDYRADEQAKQKIKKDAIEKAVSLKKNIDILKELGKKKKDQILVGFAAETESLEKNAGKKLKDKNLDMIVGNIVGGPTSGFAADTNVATLFYKDGKKESLNEMSKEALAHTILDRIIKGV
ncbi:MAG: bifunctional phosphopantothenoylcysteine decarboxylase/phosphopantothenate--cysteine ligase CoaBC [Deltaproteobacteria bacterium]|nr:bifunctional phosphopantothenoylcysteine decarboxylase/phosphopantothenate--cysteine ligase CoaBC [Deltaproteobacteria bacterium]MBW1845884.1 bifunctional phosphopantothenoylcysteine decarboxylase/phosphopantothenate--cysteine ligase CoaBC [Deltaproteobacteria bacterium]MBW2364297.1 bifunctional phosphopantothenoylcysteine decarboxylase/phosphopantothenate--cysteine ligase CoaBC [Deltaproteobacteria bacterium]